MTATYNFMQAGKTHDERSSNALATLTALALTLGFVNHAAAAGGARGPSIAVYTGYRDGGSFDDEAPESGAIGTSADIDSSETFAVSLEVPLDAARQFQIFYSFQDTEIDLTATAIGFAPYRFELPLNISYLQLGGTNYFSEEVGKGGYVVGGLGATYMDPSGDFDDELRFSLNLGLGYSLPLGKRLALRFEGRGYFTFINSSGGMFCHNGRCAVAVAGESILQGELNVGIAFGL